MKVVELARMVSGPYCAKLLADMGAEVVKVEAPVGGDPARARGPFPGDIPHHEKSGLFLYVNTSKRGVTLDIRSHTGRELLHGLLKDADIFVEDFTPGYLKSLGLGPEELTERYTKLIVLSVTPFGEYGPHSKYKMRHVNSYHATGEGYILPGGKTNLDRAPVKAGNYAGDYESGYGAAIAALGALYYQRMTGQGQHIDFSKQEWQTTLGRSFQDRYPNEGYVDTRAKNTLVFGGQLPAKDGWVMIYAAGGQRQWDGLVEAMGRPEWAKDEKFKNTPSRAKNNAELNQRLAEWTRQHTKKELYYLGQSKGVPVTISSTTEDLLNWEHLVKVRNFFTEITHPEAGTLTYPSAPWRFSETPWHASRPAPLLGEHNVEVFTALGYSKQDLVRMRGAGII